MNTPINNIILTVQDPKKTNFSTYTTNPPGPYTFDKYVFGPSKGFYKRSPPMIRYGQPLVYIKAYFPKPIKYLYRDYIHEYEGFYYIPISSIPIRRLIYGLQNYDIPASGNIEEFFKKFYNISVPDNFCPLIDPCTEEDWCNKCNKLRYQELITLENNLKNTHRKIDLSNIFYLIILISLISIVIAGALIL